MPKDMFRIPKFVGVYYRESEQRRHQGKSDRCFYITFRDANGKFVYEKVGWASEGYTAVLAAQVRGERVRQLRHGEELPSERKRKDPLFSEVWKEYDKWLDTNKSRPRDDRGTYRTHLESRYANKRLSEISPFDLEKMKSELTKQGKAAATVKHCLVLVRQLYNKASNWGMWDGLNPVKSVKLPKLDNERQRFLTVEEAELLMEKLELACPQTMKIALLSLHTGLRADETFRLKWHDIDLANGVISVIGKGGGQEKVYMTDTVKQMLSEKGPSDSYVFKARDGGKIKEVSKCYFRTIDRIGLNDGVTDHLQKVTFHTLRHTFASWLALRGEPIYTIKELMRHKDIKMTMRYAHLIPDHKRESINGIEKTIQEHRSSKLADALSTLPGLRDRSAPSAQV